MELKIELYKKLLELQKHLSVISKKGEGRGFQYIKGDDLFSKARPKMDELGLMLFHEVLETTNEHVIWKTRNGDKQQTFTDCKMLFTWVDAESGQTLEHRFSASGFNDWDKALGSALTYAERYYVLKQYHIPTGEDDPDARKEPTTAETIKTTTTGIPAIDKSTDADSLKATAPSTSEQKNEIIKLAKLKGFNLNEICSFYKCSSLPKMKFEDAKLAIAKLRLKKDVV